MDSTIEAIDEHSRLPGKIGLGLSTTLWLLASWRLVFHLFIRKQESPEEEETRRTLRICSPAKWFTRRRTFHALLWLSQSIEILAYIDISGLVPLTRNRVFGEKLGYILLDVTGRSVLEHLAFTTITGLWLKTAIQSGPSRNLDQRQDMRLRVFPALFLVTTLLLVISSATLSVFVFSKFRAQSLETIQNSSLSRAQFLLEATAWGSHALVVIQCLYLTWKRIVALVEPSPERNILLCKAVLPMAVASLIYFLRCIWLVCIYCHVSHIERGSWAWWVGFQWSPTWLAVSTLLYSARKRDHALGGELQQPLLRRPPAEAFLAFSMHRNGEDLDDSLCLNSPLMQINIANDEEVGDAETLSMDSTGGNQAPQPG
eukprot:scaffold26_cov117-Cylindrotheca_fusiformis.AAC.17